MPQLQNKHLEASCICALGYRKAGEPSKKRVEERSPFGSFPNGQTHLQLQTSALKQVTASFLVTCFHLFLVVKCKQKHLCFFLFPFFFF